MARTRRSPWRVPWTIITSPARGQLSLEACQCNAVAMSRGTRGCSFGCCASHAVSGGLSRRFVLHFLDPSTRRGIGFWPVAPCSPRSHDDKGGYGAMAIYMLAKGQKQGAIAGSVNSAGFTNQILVKSVQFGMGCSV